MRNILTSLSKRRLRHQKSQQSHRSRRLLLEQLEDRRLLASLPTWEAQGPGPILSGQVEGTQHVRGHVIFLDFDGAREVTYRGPVTVGPFDIPAFVAPKNLAHRETDIVTSVVSSLNNNFAASGLVFTTQQPDTTLPFSTIFIGGSDDAFSAYGSFLGLAEQVDFGNQAPADNAFVFSESIMTTSFEVSAYAEDLSEVVAHEVGHHVQTLLGISQQVNKARQQVSQTEGNQLSVRQELQADCLAGLWAKQTNQRTQFLEQGDIAEAMDAAEKIGDDYLQRKSRGSVVPDSFTHGTSEQRQRWFNRGFTSGDINQCDTFNTNSL